MSTKYKHQLNTVHSSVTCKIKSTIPFRIVVWRYFQYFSDIAASLAMSARSRRKFLRILIQLARSFRIFRKEVSLSLYIARYSQMFEKFLTAKINVTLVSLASRNFRGFWSNGKRPRVRLIGPFACGADCVFNREEYLISVTTMNFTCYEFVRFLLVKLK